MELAYELFGTAFTAILLSFLVAKLLSLAVSGGDASGDNGLCTAVDNGGEEKGPIGVEEGNLEKRFKVQGLKSKKKRLKKISSDSVLVSEFKGETEPTAASAKISGGLTKPDDFIDDREKLGCEEKDLEFPGRRVDDCYFGVVDSVKNESLLSSYEKPLKFREEVEPTKKDIVDGQPSYLTSVEKVIAHNEDNVISGNAGEEMEISDGEEWEGIERNELEKDFIRAINYLEFLVKDGRLNKFGSDAIMQFHDLQKIAMEGACHEPKISSGAKWNSWQNLRSMNAEEAMEKYITLLSDIVPGWIDGHPYLESKTSSEMDDACRSSYTAGVSSPLIEPLACTNESKLGEELVSGTGGGDLAGRLYSDKKFEV